MFRGQVNDQYLLAPDVDIHNTGSAHAQNSAMLVLWFCGNAVSINEVSLYSTSVVEDTWRVLCNSDRIR